MTKIAAGDLDRRILIQQATETQDRTGDVVLSWNTVYRRWAQKKENSGREFFGAQQMVRDADTMFIIRKDSTTGAIAPESHRVVYRGTIFEIVSIAEGPDRHDSLQLICASRPDQRGAREKEQVTG